MANKKKFEAPQGGVYGSLIQSGGNQPAPSQTPAAEPAQEFYRFSLKLPMECRDYLQEMAWRNRITITELLTRIIMADMEAHPEWKETVDVLNIPRK